MADNNRNQRGSERSSNQDWNDNRNGNGRNDEGNRNYGSSENRGYGNSSEFDEGSSSWQSRYQRDREDYNRGDQYSSGQYGRHYEGDTNSSGNWGNERDSGYASYYGSGSGSSYGSGSGSTGSGNSGNRRNLYDRDYEGMNRGSYSNSGTRLGGANYGNYGDRGRFDEGRNEGRNFGNSGSNYGGGNPGGGNRDDRGWFNRASDEVSSWFGNDDAERRRDRDRQMRGEHKGKGPKNYNRSDDRIKDDINDRLSDDSFIDASEIEVVVVSGEVTLSGTVDDRSAKRRAEDLAESVSGVKNVENKIRVGQGSQNRNNDKDQNKGTERESQNGGSQSTSGVSGSERNRNKNYVTG